jgi:hypothetical protein
MGSVLIVSGLREWAQVAWWAKIELIILLVVLGLKERTKMAW